LLVLAVGAIFAQTLGHDFVNYDDPVYVQENPQVFPGLSRDGLAWALGARYASNWHPLTWVAHMFDCQLFGLWAPGHHATSCLLHAANAVLLFLLLGRMTGRFWPSALAAAVFAVHPLRAESVAWVAERKDLLAGLCFMLTLWVYVDYVRHPRSTLRYLHVVLWLALGLTAKPMLVTLPLVLLLLDYWPLCRSGPEHGASGRHALTGSDNTPLSPGGRGAGGEGACVLLAPLSRLLWEKASLLALAGASCAATLWAQQPALKTLEHLPWSQRLGNAATAYALYLGEFFWPRDLAVFYPLPRDGVPVGAVAASCAILAAVSAVAVAARRAHPYLTVGWLWFLGMLVPVIGLVQVGAQSMADRYTYLPQIGLSIALAWGAAALAHGPPLRCRAGSLAAGLLLLALSACAWRQTGFWRNSETLWSRALACAPANAVALNGLGLALATSGRLPQAIDVYRQALACNSDDARVLNNLGHALLQSGSVPEAMERFQHALAIAPDFPQAHFNLGHALAGSGRVAAAAQQFQAALRAEPNYAEAHAGLGGALLEMGRLTEALDHYQQALRIKPGYAAAHNNLGEAQLASGQLAEAIVHCREAIRLRPDYAAAHYNLGCCFTKAGRQPEAAAELAQAVRLARASGQNALAQAAAAQLHRLRTPP
jgi:tetratricopeptide (TPR) repeat protein